MGFKVLAIGDICLKKEHNHVLADEELLNMMREYDIVSCDFGIPLCSSAKNGKIKVGPYESQLDHSVAKCKELGINLARLAGNHIMDYGIEGAQKLIDELKAAAIDSIGVSEDYQKAYTPIVYCINGIRIAFFSAGEMEFGCSYEEGMCGFAWINNHELDNQIQGIRDKVDYIFIFPHAGEESIPVPMQEWRNRYYSLIDLGADFIIATHPHIIQGIERYGKGLIAYSLGNFAYDYENPDNVDDWSRSIGISFDLSANTYSYDVIPFQYHGEMVEIVNDETFQKKFQFANSLLLNKELYRSELDRACEERWYRYYYDYYTQNAVKGGGEIDSAFLFHNIGIESHDYLCRRALWARMYVGNNPENSVLEEKYLLWGAGKIGHAALEYCKKKRIEIIGMTDSNKNLLGKLIGGYQILHVNEAMRMLREQSDVIVMACVGTRDMCEIKGVIFDELGSRRCISYEDFRVRILKRELLEELQKQ